MIAYKYRPYGQRTLEILLNRELYFCSVDALNDPLDSRADLETEYKRLFGKLNQATDEPAVREAFLMFLLDAHYFTDPKTKERMGLHKTLQLYMATLGILSLSQNPKDPLLWSHYGDSHRGVCLGFDTDLIQGKGLGTRGAIKYQSRPQYESILLSLAQELGEFCRPWDKHDFPAEQGDRFYSHQISELVRGNLLVKSEKWKYEEEYRIIRSEPGLQAFAPEALRFVIFGTKTTEANERTIRSIIGAPHYAHVKIRRASHTPGSFDFDILER